MNTGDYCAEGRELYEIYLNWKYYHWKDWGVPGDIRLGIVERDAYLKFKQHIDACAECSGKDGE